MGGAGLIARLALILAWLAGSLLWLSADRLIRDGDEEGHVGAAELLMHTLTEDGLLPFLAASFAGDLGEYPPLYPAAVAAWWALHGGQPGAVVVRAINLLWPLIAALSCGAIARRLSLSSLPVVAAVLLIPGVCGLSRHFMPEGMLVAAVSLAALLALQASEAPGWRRAAVLGGVLGLGCLIKQTFILYTLPLALWALWRLRIRGVATITVATIVAGPWYLTHLSEQARYGSQSLQTTDPGWLLTLAYYPIVGVASELGVVLAAAVLLGLRQASPEQRRLIGLWVGLSLALLVLTPRKYPRLLVPLLPLVVIWIGAVARSRPQQVALVGLAGIVVGVASLITLPSPPLVERVDDGCRQRWLRPPVSEDFGLQAVAAAARQRQATVVSVLDSPDIPCSVQTTHRWIDHLQPYLRREGIEAAVVEEPISGALIIDWSGGSHDSPLLGRRFDIR